MHSQNTAKNSIGQNVPTFNVQHGIISRQRLTMRFTIGAADVPNLPIFPGVGGMKTFTTAGIGDATGQGINAVLKIDGFATVEEFAKYFERAGVAIEGAKIYSSDLSNFTSEFIHEEKYAYGVDPKVGYEPLETYRVPLGTGYSNDITIPAEKLVWRLWYGLKIALSRAKANSSITIQFNVIAQDKAFEASALNSSVIQ